VATGDDRYFAMPLKKSMNAFVNGSWYSWPPSKVHMVSGAAEHESATKQPGAPVFGGALQPF
jgi:hypothetical protein